MPCGYRPRTFKLLRQKSPRTCACWPILLQQAPSRVARHSQSMEGRRTAVSVLDDLASRLGGWTLSECASLLEGLEVEVDSETEVILGHEVSHGVVQLRLSRIRELVTAQAATLACSDVADLADDALADAERDAERVKRALREAKRAVAADEKARAEAAVAAAAAEKERVDAQLRDAIARAEAAAAADLMPRTLLSLNDDLLLTIARALLAIDHRAALRLLQTCMQARDRLGVIQAEAAAAVAAEADAAFAELQRQATDGYNSSAYVRRQGDWAISGKYVHKEDSMSHSTYLYYLRGGQPRCVRDARWREHDTMRGGNDGSSLSFGRAGEVLEHQFEGRTDRLRLADLVPKAVAGR